MEISCCAEFSKLMMVSISPGNESTYLVEMSAWIFSIRSICVADWARSFSDWPRSSCDWARSQSSCLFDSCIARLDSFIARHAIPTLISVTTAETSVTNSPHSFGSRRLKRNERTVPPNMQIVPIAHHQRPQVRRTRAMLFDSGRPSCSLNASPPIV